MGAWKRSPEQQAKYEEAKQQMKDGFKDLRKGLEESRRDAGYNSSPVGQAQASYERGDQLFQVSFNLEDVKAFVVWMDDAHTQRRANDVSEVLNAISQVGWNLHSMSTAFVTEGESSRDKFLMSGQQVAVRGRLVGTYVFYRRR